MSTHQKKNPFFVALLLCQLASATIATATTAFAIIQQPVSEHLYRTFIKSTQFH